MRRLLLPAFSAKRMRLLAGHVQDLVDALLDDMIAAHDGTSVDLQHYLAAPLPVYVISELLGVPAADRAYFRDLSERAATVTGADPRVALGELTAYATRLAHTKRIDPGEDVLTDLVKAQRANLAIDDAAIANLAAGLIFAGHETTLSRITFGVLLLLTNPTARQELVDNPDSVAGVVEEVLRLAAPSDFGLARYAREDIVVGQGEHQVTIERGDAVILVTPAANRDGKTYEHPDTFDAARSPNPHMTFGYGPRLCIGASLARTELSAVFGTLFTRLPGIRLAVDPAELRLHTDRFTGGLHALPVTW